ncbi:MAG: ferrous iron transport protein A [Ruminococcaceae bacterium]|nr:ferrous iron transport protein A [Oscillospiraceae bacterium]
MKTMKSLLPGQKGTISEISDECLLKIRLTDIGFTPDEPVLCLMQSPLGDPKLYFVKGAAYAVRNRDADRIILYDNE